MVLDRSTKQHKKRSRQIVFFNGWLETMPKDALDALINLFKIITKSAKNDTKIDDNASLECFWCQIAHGSALQVPPGNEKSPFRLKMVLQDAILEPSVDSKSVKNHKLGLDWRKPPRKMSSGRGVGKNMKK